MSAAPSSDDLAGLVDIPALERFLDERLGGHVPITVWKHTAGYSNVTLFIDRGDQRLVLRRPPTGPLLPSAHDVIREWRFISALWGRARVPRPVAACEDSSVIGAPFYVMERVNGTEIRDSIPAPYDHPAGRRKMAEELIDALVEVHAVDWRSTDLSAPPTSFAERQVRRGRRQWELTRPHTRDLPDLDRAADWLEAHLPEERERTIVHGDYKLDNVLFDLQEPKLLAILDWELATLGDPLGDVGWLLSTWGDPRDLERRGTDEDEVLAPSVTLREGFPTRQELAQMYAERSGRPLADMHFWLGLAMFKGAVIGEGIYMRYLQGNVTNPQGARMKDEVPKRVARLMEVIEAGTV